MKGTEGALMTAAAAVQLPIVRKNVGPTAASTAFEFIETALLSPMPLQVSSVSY